MGVIKIGYFADGPWSHEAFKLLNGDGSVDISFVCVRYDTTDDTLAKMAEKNGIPCLKHKDINSPEFMAMVREFLCDLFVSMSFNQIFKTEIINLPKYKAINCHAGKLPFYRGRNVLNWLLINDEVELGITVHYIDEGIDTGDIIIQRTYPVTDSDTYKTLLELAYVACADILYDAIKMIQGGKVKAIKQGDIHPEGMYCTQRKQGDEMIDWNQSSREVFNFVRALCYPGPKASTSLAGSPVLINRAEIVVDAPGYKGINGAVIGVDGEKYIVKTGDTFIKISELDFDGKIRVGARFG
ncbi:MAG: methionyl-tRNA formyltransferase [Cycloclasticus sp.]|nr:methionyl-tRNA formyltransferase [Cycloclasticus sp.]